MQKGRDFRTGAKATHVIARASSSGSDDLNLLLESFLDNIVCVGGDFEFVPLRRDMGRVTDLGRSPAEVL
jgi:hypothetical protein